MKSWQTFVLTALMASAACGQFYAPFPDWESSDDPVSTGAALIDLDLDGWLDLVVANGNDIARERITVYYNQGDGTFPALPDWSSSDIAYHGHLDIGDVNGDGYPDVAVANLGTGGFIEPAAKLYLNHSGTLSSSPDWISPTLANAFGVAIGDMDQDGLPDLAIATGWPYSNPDTYSNYVYPGNGETFDTTPSWVSSDQLDYMLPLWLDADGDGHQDLLMTGANHNNAVYRNHNGLLSPSVSWTTTDNPNQFGIMPASGDVTDDGLRDLIVTDNTQIFQGSGLFRRYTALQEGYFETTPSWSYFDQYGSAIALGDVNADGLLDLAVGGWWSNAKLFINEAGTFNSYPDYTSTQTSVIEKIVFGDVDNDGLRRRVEMHPGDGQRKYFELSVMPVQRILGVYTDGVELLPHEFLLHYEQGWIVLDHAPLESLRVDLEYSIRLDMAISNWDGSTGNFLYYHLAQTEGDCTGDGIVDLTDLNCFFECITGPQAAGSLDHACDRFDVDMDQDVDLFDYTAMQSLFE